MPTISRSSALTTGSDISSTNLIAYTATLGGGLSATISMEDPIFRRNPVFNQGGVFGLSTGLVGTIPAAGFGGNGANVFIGNPQAVSPVGVTFDPVTGLPTVARLIDVVQRNGVPDFVGALRLDQPWGSAQLSGAVHEIQIGNFDPNTGSVFAANGTASFPGAFLTPFGNNTAGTGFVSPLAVAPVASNVALTTLGTTTTANALNVAAANAAVAGAGPGRRPANEYGWAIQGGLKLNLPFIAPGDLLYLQAAYSEGAALLHRRARCARRELNANNLTNRFAVNTNDAAVDAFGRLHLTKSWSVAGALQHYWTPQIRSAVFGSYAKIDYDSILRTGFGPAGVLPIATVNGVTNFGNALNLALSPTLRDYTVSVIGSNTIWSPVKDLDIGLETVYQRSISTRVASSTRTRTCRSARSTTRPARSFPSVRQTRPSSSNRSSTTISTKPASASSATSDRSRNAPRKPRLRAGVSIWDLLQSWGRAEEAPWQGPDQAAIPNRPATKAA